MMVMKKSSRMLERPTQTKAETKTLVIMVKINGQEAIVLLDSRMYHIGNISRKWYK